MVSDLSFILYPLLIFLPHYLYQLTFSPLSSPPSEYVAPSVQAGISKLYKHVAPDRPTRPIQQWQRTPPLPNYPTTTTPPGTNPSLRPNASKNNPPPPPLTSVIIFQALTVSGIKIFFSSLLLWFTSHFLVPDVNANSWSRMVVSLPPTPLHTSAPPPPIPAETWRGRYIPLPNS